MCHSPRMHRALLGTGSGLMLASLLLTWLLSAVDPSWAAENATTLASLDWAQRAALVLGAALVAAGLVVARLAPAPRTKREAREDAPSDWFS